MANSRLGLDEVQALIQTYTAEKAKLEFQLRNTNEIIEQLLKRKSKLSSKAVKTLESAAKTALRPKRGPGRPPKARPTSAEAPKRRGRPPKAKAVESGNSKAGTAEGYRLSDWDNLLLDTLEQKGRALKKVEIDEIFRDFAKTVEPGWSDAQIYTKASRVIHKLANKRGTIRKQDIPGKGYAYGLSGWFAKNGKIKKDHSWSGDDQSSSQGVTSAAPKRRGPGRPPKSAGTAGKAKRRGRPPKVKTETSPAPKRRGRPPKAKAESQAPKRRGRPPKSASAGSSKSTSKHSSKRRGRPPKSAKANSGKTSNAPKRRGRPPKAKVDSAAPKRRGRPPKIKTKTSTAPKRRGRPPKKK